MAFGMQLRSTACVAERQLVVDRPASSTRVRVVVLPHVTAPLE
jgi:hypothetical protein